MKAVPLTAGAEWEAMVIQAGHSSRAGGYRDSDGRHAQEGRPHGLSVIGEIVENLETGAADGAGLPQLQPGADPLEKPKTPLIRGQMTMEASGRDHPHLNLQAPSHNLPPITAAEGRSENM